MAPPGLGHSGTRHSTIPSHEIYFTVTGAEPVVADVDVLGGGSSQQFFICIEKMESPFQGPGGGQAHLPHQTSYPSSQGLIMPPNTAMMPAEIPEGQTEMETTPGMNPTGLANPQQKDISISMICRMGQETVQDIITKSSELFSLLKTLQPPNGTAASINAQEERKAKVQDFLRTITFCFTKLRRICERCNYSSATMEYTHIEVDSLVPLKDEVDSRQDDRKPADAVRTSSAEYNHLKEWYLDIRVPQHTSFSRYEPTSK
ncbi:mediator of RNA polymerase II transcription subunit 30 [Caerostris darwini]|uniref:Mediator of RNA polymerase II transcription subunit 30 n=1 Tax=Caerostris darwini TaxID=1538125 RepID=A0AAV4WQS7_9ARAC|nr:mediator of RNA polymerase II transcription subunit 30 [Caerostris darwini]